MSSKRERVEIDGHIFFIRRFAPLTALSILGDLQKLLMKPLAKLDTADILDATAKVDGDMGSIMEVVSELSTSLGGEVLEKWRRILVNQDNVAIALGDEHMPEQLTDALIDQMLGVETLLELMVRSALINFKAVFTKASSRVGEALKSKARLPLASSATD